MDFATTIFRRLFFITLSIRGESYVKDIEKYKASQYLPLDEQQAEQLTKLNRLIAAARETEHYRSLPKTPITSLCQLRDIPFLEKDQIRNHPQSFMRQKRPNQRLKTSGGSTGAPVTILKDSDGVSKEMAASWRGYYWAGIEEGDRQARFWGLPKSTKEKVRARVIDFIAHRKRITAFGYNDKSFQEAIVRLERFDPSYFYGYASIISELARYIVANKITPKLCLKSIITTAEVISEDDRRCIERAFKTRVFDEYGCGEVGTIAHQCEHGAMHINSENVIVEVLDQDGRPTPKGTPGEIVITDLTNFSMPLIRYKLKDFASLSESACDCGRTLPVIEKIHGRQYDILTNSTGKRFHGEFFLYILEDARKAGLNPTGAQFIQNEALALTVKIVTPASDFETLKDYITKRIIDDFDSTIPIDVQHVEYIEREPSGKMRVVKKEHSGS